MMLESMAASLSHWKVMTYHDAPYNGITCRPKVLQRASVPCMLMQIRYSRDVTVRVCSVETYGRRVAIYMQLRFQLPDNGHFAF